jgi:hypothetical protein
MSKIYINQSLVKDLIKYQNDELCGLIFHNKWILQTICGGSKANDLGHYSEWLCTGQFRQRRRFKHRNLKELKVGN